MLPAQMTVLRAFQTFTAGSHLERRQFAVTQMLISIHIKVLVESANFGGGVDTASSMNIGPDGATGRSTTHLLRFVLLCIVQSLL